MYKTEHKVDSNKRGPEITHKQKKTKKKTNKQTYPQMIHCAILTLKTP